MALSVRRGGAAPSRCASRSWSRVLRSATRGLRPHLIEQQPLDLRGEIGDHGSLEQAGEREVDVEARVQPRHEPRGEQRVSAAREEVVEGADVPDAEDRLERVGDGMLRGAPGMLRAAVVIPVRGECVAVEVSVGGGGGGGEFGEAGGGGGGGGRFGGWGGGGGWAVRWGGRGSGGWGGVGGGGGGGARWGVGWWWCSRR